jgi:membrane protease YdiL (CAAX protease family)
VIFLMSLALSVGGYVAVELGAPEAAVDVALTVAFALTTLGCVLVARREMGVLLAKAGGVRGMLEATALLGAIVVFGAVYFPALHQLGFSYRRLTDAYVQAGWPAWTLYLLISIAPAVLEEITFRGYVMSRLSGPLTARECLIVQACLFSVLHISVASFPSHFLIGLGLGYLRQRTASLYPGMVAHAGWNAVVVFAEVNRAFPFGLS